MTNKNKGRGVRNVDNYFLGKFTLYNLTERKEVKWWSNLWCKERIYSLESIKQLLDHDDIIVVFLTTVWNYWKNRTLLCHIILRLPHINIRNLGRVSPVRPHKSLKDPPKCKTIWKSILSEGGRVSNGHCRRNHNVTDNRKLFTEAAS